MFSTRAGGVSEGPYDSLNLGRMTGDDVERVDENRRRLCAEVGGTPERLALNRQIHSSLVHCAEPGARGEPGDGLWTEEPDLPVLVMSADCVPIALARVGDGRPGVAVLHAGWRGLLAGVVAEGVAALGGTAHAAIGPAIGPCCYEVGARWRSPSQRRSARTCCTAASSISGQRPSVLCARRVSRTIERVDLCTSCNPDRFFSHRRTGKPRGVQGVIARVA